MLKNKSILLGILVILLILIIPSIVRAEETQSTQIELNGVTANFTYTLNKSDEIEKLKCTNAGDLKGAISIPSKINDKNVVAVGSNAFEGGTGITEITIPSSVKEIGYSAFKDCTNLSKVDLGSIEDLEFDIFKGCTSLKSIKIPKTLKSGATVPCLNNSNITSITFEEGLTVIPSYLCANTGITEVTIPSSVKEIEHDAFENCTSLSKVNLGSIENISFDVFKGCTSLKSIKIPKTLKNGATVPCLNNSNITNITFEEGLTVIPSYLCANTGITEVTIPSSVKEIEHDAFENCTNLSKINLGSIEDISFDVFKGCTSLKSIKIPKTLKSGATAPCLNNSNITSITFEEGLTVIPSYLCANTGITEITIPSSVKEIEHNAFEDCKNLKKITILDNVTKMGWWSLTYQTDTDCIFINHNDDLTIYCYEGSTAADYAVNTKIKYVFLKKPANSGTSNKQDEANNSGNKNNSTTNGNTKDDTLATTKLPNTGSVVVVWSIGVVAVIGTVAYIRYKKLKGVK